MLTQAELQSKFIYNPSNGIFTRIQTSKNAGCIKSNGYVVISINYKTYTAHRLAWLYMYGEFPKNCIDHINNNRLDNRICNLREATKQENNRNSLKSIKNKSGIKGIHWNKARNKWVAQITINYKIKTIGYTIDFFDACCLIISKRNKLHGIFAKS